MNAHVTSTDFLPGATVGLYPPQSRPEQHQDPIEALEVPADGQVVFEREQPYERYWLAGFDADGRWKTVQSHSKPGEPVNVAEKLALTRPGEDFRAPIVGARGTIHTLQARRRRGE